MNSAPLPNDHLWAAVALRSGSLPPPAVLQTWLSRFAPNCRAEEAQERIGEDAGAERRLVFREHAAEVGAAAFPRKVTGHGKRTLAPHSGHVFLSLSIPGPGALGRRTLARASGAIAATADTAFVWWGRSGGVYRPSDFLARVEGRT